MGRTVDTTAVEIFRLYKEGYPDKKFKYLMKNILIDFKYKISLNKKTESKLDELYKEVEKYRKVKELLK